MKKNTSWKFTDELSVTFQSSVTGAGEFGLGLIMMYGTYSIQEFHFAAITKLILIPGKNLWISKGLIGLRWELSQI